MDSFHALWCSVLKHLTVFEFLRKMKINSTRIANRRRTDWGFIYFITKTKVNCIQLKSERVVKRKLKICQQDPNNLLSCFVKKKTPVLFHSFFGWIILLLEISEAETATSSVVMIISQKIKNTDGIFSTLLHWFISPNKLYRSC